ncbi:MAG: hypothetical protein H7330_17030 [Hymenobacteraceae bacterium]|nr:hypothetical protein [Hymenobacteraceae bacterium]
MAASKTPASTRDHDADNAREDAKNERPADRTQDGETPRARSGNHTDHRRGDDDDRADKRKPGGEHMVPTTPNATSSEGRKNSE